MTAKPATFGEIRISEIIPDPRQPRKHFDDAALEQLAASIKEQGVIEPIIVRPVNNGAAKYVLVAGERRWRAAQRKSAGPLTTIPAVVRDYDPQKAHVAQLAENMDREGLRPTEVAESYARWLEATKRTQAELAKALGKTEAHVSQVLSLRALPQLAVTLIDQGKIDFTAARELAKLVEHPRRLENVLDGVKFGELVSTRQIGDEVKWQLQQAAEEDRRVKEQQEAQRKASEQRTKTKQNKRAQAEAKKQRELEARRRKQEERDAARVRAIDAARPAVAMDAAPTWAKRVIAIRKKLRLPDAYVALIAGEYNPGDVYGPRMTRHSQLLVKAIAPHLPGKFDKSVALYGRPYRNAAAALSWVALALWLQLETDGLDAGLEKAAAAYVHDKALGQPPAVNARKAAPTKPPARKGGRK